MKKVPCIHGLEEENCPNCRILKSTIPIQGLTSQETRFVDFKNPLFKKNQNLDENLKGELIQKRLGVTTNSLNRIPQPTLLNKIPNIENRMFVERFKELDVTKEDTFGISKKIPLEKPGWKFEEED